MIYVSHILRDVMEIVDDLPFCVMVQLIDRWPAREF